MDKHTFATAIAKAFKIEEREANRLANHYFAELEYAFTHKEEIEFHDFGQYYLREIAPYETNTIHKTRIRVENSVNITFKQGKKLKKAINQ